MIVLLPQRRHPSYAPGLPQDVPRLKSGPRGAFSPKWAWSNLRSAGQKGVFSFGWYVVLEARGIPFGLACTLWISKSLRVKELRDGQSRADAGKSKRVLAGLCKKNKAAICSSMLSIGMCLCGFLGGFVGLA